MDGNITVKYLQSYLKQKDFVPGREMYYFLKLVEEVGEVSGAIFHGKFRQPGQSIKGTLDEELWDVMYFVLCLANLYGIDMEAAIQEKEQLNNLRWHDKHPFELGR